MSEQPTTPPPDDGDSPFLGWPTASLFPTTLPPRVEPNADQRQAATHFRGMYVALVNEGFTVPEAMTLIVAMIQKPS